MADLTTALDDMTDEELRERLRQIRHNRSVERPAMKAKKAAAVHKASKAKVSKLDKAVDNMTDEERNELLKLLEGAGNV